MPKTACTTPLGLCEFRVLCFGLTTAPGTFHNIMNDVLKDVIGKFVIVYLNDIVVYSKDQAEHCMQAKHGTVKSSLRSVRALEGAVGPATINTWLTPSLLGLHHQSTIDPIIKSYQLRQLRINHQCHIDAQVGLELFTSL